MRLVPSLTTAGLIAVLLTSAFVGFVHPAPLGVGGALLLIVTAVIAQLWLAVIFFKGKDTRP